jgi:hypothetical protein
MGTYRLLARWALWLRSGFQVRPEPQSPICQDTPPVKTETHPASTAPIISRIDKVRLLSAANRTIRCLGENYFLNHATTPNTSCIRILFML